MKLNLGCGFNHLEGYLNVDQHPSTGADFVCNLETLPWPWEDNSIEEIQLKHVLEHLGQQTEKHLDIIKEIYRVCKSEALVVIEVPHPLHPDYLGDPTHCRPITYESLRLFDLDFADLLIASHSPGTPLARYMGVDLAVIDNQQFFDTNSGQLQVTRTTLKVRKPFREIKKDITICEISPGLGDACMSLCVAHALSDLGYRVKFATAPEWLGLAQACPHVDSVSLGYTTEGSFLSPAWFQLQGYHQVNTLLNFCGVKAWEVPAKSKSLDLNLPPKLITEMEGKFPGNKRVVINPVSNVESRKWPLENWQELVHWLRASEIEVYSLGMSNWYGANNTQKLDGVIDIFDLPSLATIAFLRQCKVLVSADSGPIQLAGATDCGIVGLYSVISSEWRLPHRHGELGWNAIGINTSCPHAPCFPGMVYNHDYLWTPEAISRNLPIGDLVKSWCPNGEVTCMKQISVNSVYDAVMQLWNS